MFRGAPQQLQALEKRLLRQADLVFTGGVSLFEAKRHCIRDVYPFPSGVDVQHFAAGAQICTGDFQEHRRHGAAATGICRRDRRTHRP